MKKIKDSLFATKKIEEKNIVDPMIEEDKKDFIFHINGDFSSYYQEGEFLGEVISQ